MFLQVFAAACARVNMGRADPGVNLGLGHSAEGALQLLCALWLRYLLQKVSTKPTIIKLADCLVVCSAGWHYMTVPHRLKPMALCCRGAGTRSEGGFCSKRCGHSGSCTAGCVVLYSPI